VPSPFACFPKILALPTLPAGLLVPLLALLGCANAAPRLVYGASGPEAVRQFSEEAYCPIERVHVRVVDPSAPPPPPAILRDPERLAMWDAALDRRGRKPDVKRVVFTAGCGQSAEFTCWQDGRPASRGRRGVELRPRATVCVETVSNLDVVE
jgi:hypothetical protein